MENSISTRSNEYNLAKKKFRQQLRRFVTSGAQEEWDSLPVARAGENTPYRPLWVVR